MHCGQNKICIIHEKSCIDFHNTWEFETFFSPKFSLWCISSMMKKIWNNHWYKFLKICLNVYISYQWRYLLQKQPGPHLNIKSVFLGIGTPSIKIRRSSDHLIFIMGIYILVRCHIYIELTPRIGIWNIIRCFENYGWIFCKTNKPRLSPFTYSNINFLIARLDLIIKIIMMSQWLCYVYYQIMLTFSTMHSDCPIQNFIWQFPKCIQIN